MGQKRHLVANLCIKLNFSFSSPCRNKEIEEEKKSREINKDLNEKKNDWWGESGGPPVTNEGQVANVIEMNQDIVAYKIRDWGQS